MLKHIHIFGSLLLVVILAVVVAVWACDDLKAVRDAAQAALRSGQIVVPTQEASPRTQETGKAVYAPGSFGEWLKKDMELSAKEFQLIKKLADVLPDTAEGCEHLRADDQLNREVKRKLDEIEVELGEAVRESHAHEKPPPVGP